MQLSSNVIKNTSIRTQGNKEILTDYAVNYAVAEEIKEDNTSKSIENFENLAKKLLNNARLQSEAIIAKAHEEAERLENQAYSKGYENGREQGYKDAYEEVLGPASEQAGFLVENANRILEDAKLEYERYLEEKKEEILRLALNMAETILKKKISEPDGLNEMIEEVLSSTKSTDTFIIRANSVYVDEIKLKVEQWKNAMSLKGEIFVLGDEAMETGNAVIEKSNGRVIIGLDFGMESIRAAIS